MSKKMVSELRFSKEIVAENESALAAYQLYRRANKIIEKVKAASGKSGSFQLKNNSTVNITLDAHGIGSTQKV
ncbi:hypothetical protein A3A66_01800 [Microgenomates group bacterium RIFCSPLOWO2_01_FULL_46_13]|nr:MAG: hypothetical protein A3A66_01800 [Microgenomates group bacterium RIFCSPLOWO2_01_FULL_46_13]